MGTENITKLEIGGEMKTFEAMTVDQYNSSMCTYPFQLGGPGKGRQYFKTFTYYVKGDGWIDELHSNSIIYVCIN